MKTKKMNKWIIVILCILVIGVVFYVSYIKFIPPIYSLKTIDYRAYNLIEKNLKISLPEGTTVKNVSLEGWHEVNLYAKVEVPDDRISDFIVKSGGFNESVDLADLNNDISWWRIEKDKCDKKIRTNNPPITYIICKPNNGKVEIFITCWLVNSLSEDEWRIFKE